MKLVKHFPAEAGVILVDMLADKAGISKSAAKNCLNKGGVWLKRPGKKEQRIRRARYELKRADRISLYYDDEILRRQAVEPRCIASESDYSVWYKPAGLLSQGTRFGDHCSLLRIAEKLHPGKTAYLVHRLDREAHGLVIIAHSKASAGRFSKIFQKSEIDKRYEATVHGLFASPGEMITLDSKLDNKSAVTRIKVIEHKHKLNRSVLDIQLQTGRYHQIRRHLSLAGHPIVGDKRYGKKDDGEPLALEAYRLTFTDPVTGVVRNYSLR